MKIFKVGCVLSWTQYTIRVIEVEANETKSGYSFRDDYSERLISKNKLLIVDSRLRNTINGKDYDVVSFLTYCLEADKEKAIELVWRATEKLFKELKASIGNMQMKELGSPVVVNDTMNEIIKRKNE